MNRQRRNDRFGKTELKVDKIVGTEVDEYYTFPEGGRFMNRNGIPDVWEYRVIERVLIFSLIENCKLNDIDLQDYLKHLFECIILHGKDCNKKVLLSCFYKSEC